MKSKVKYLFAFLFIGIISFSSCKKETEVPQDDTSIMPTNFKIDIPSTISNTNIKKSTTAGEFATGDEIYGNLRTFIAIGEGASDIVVGIIGAINLYHINKPMTMTYQNGDDNRSKVLEVVEGASFENVNYEYKMTISDALSMKEADMGKGIQIFWNRSPIKGVAILKPYNIDRSKNADAPAAMFKIEYSEAGENPLYDATMIVSINGLPTPPVSVLNPDAQYAINNLKMFVGKKGDIIDVRGNSNHPNAVLNTQTTPSNQIGFNWAFVASSLQSINIGVAEVALPPSSSNITDRDGIMNYYGIKTVLTREIKDIYPLVDDAALSSYLLNADAPGYFNNGGFIQGGTAPSASYSAIQSRIATMSPYNPIEISTLSSIFQ